MLTGYFTLTGDSDVPTFDTAPYHDDLIPERQQGGLHLFTTLPSYGFDIPARDKQVLLFGDYREEITTVDSDFADKSYQEKLSLLNFGESLGLILNRAKHGSLAVLGCPYHYGLYDTISGSAHYLFTTDSSRLQEILNASPLRYLIYRFPLNTPIVFIQAEGVCSKWWRWMKTHKSPLHAFNALEHKLHGLPKA